MSRQMTDKQRAEELVTWSDEGDRYTVWCVKVFGYALHMGDEGTARDIRRKLVKLIRDVRQETEERLKHRRRGKP